MKASKSSYEDSSLQTLVNKTWLGSEMGENYYVRNAPL